MSVMAAQIDTETTAFGGAVVLDAQSLAFGYGKEQQPVYDQLSFSLQEGEVVCLLGASGCGKSTLLRTLAGLLKPTSGSVRFAGKPLERPHPRAALVFQQPGLLPWLDVEGNVGFGLDFRHQPALDTSERRQRVAKAIEAVGLEGMSKLYPSQLSGGMRQRVALARALARAPQVMFADEPFSALDPVLRAEMQQLLVSLLRQWSSAAVLVTHDIDEALAVGDRILLMAGRPGRIRHAWRTPSGDGDARLRAAKAALRDEILEAMQRIRNASLHPSSSLLQTTP